MPDLFNQMEDELTLVSNDRESLGDNFLSPTAKAKELNQQIGWVITQRKTEYLSDLMKLKSHSSVQIRRKVADGLSSISTKEILYEVKKWQETEADRQTWLCLESLIDKLERGVTGAELSKEVKILSVSEAIGLVKKLLGEGSYTIEGELCEVRPVREFYYFGVKDSEDARLDCFCLGRVASRAGFALNEGLNVRLEGKFKLGKNSRLIFDVTSIKLTGEGELLRNLKLLQEKLTQEGLFDVARKRPVPRLPRNILLLASPNSAAIADFRKVLDARRRGINIYFLPIKTQGVGSEFDIICKLELARDIANKYGIDTMVMTRGGGSSDDLFVFNSEKIVRSLHAMPVPTIVAIGHERDVTLSELTADLRASTPSNAAELVSVSSLEVLQESRLFYEQLVSLAREKVAQYRGTGEKMMLIATSQIKQEIGQMRQIMHSTDKGFSLRLMDIRNEVGQLWRLLIDRVGREVNEIKCNLVDLNLLNLQVRNQVETHKVALKGNRKEIQESLKYQLQLIRSQFESTQKQIQLSDPKNILDKGFAIVRNGDKLIEDAAKIESGLTLQIQFRDGDREARAL